MSRAADPGAVRRARFAETARYGAPLYKQMFPDCHLVFIYDAGHAITAERPESFTEVVVSDFLDRHDAFVVDRTPTVIHPKPRRRTARCSCLVTPWPRDPILASATSSKRG